MRLCKPPLFLMSLFTIQEVADPHAINSMSLRCAAQAFQKYSRASTNALRGVSIHGISSKKITFRSFAGLLSMSACSSWKAFSQLPNVGLYVDPL